MSTVARVRREIRAALELWLAPLVVAVLPYRAGIAVARWIARVLPIYAAASEAGGRAYTGVVPQVNAGAWRAEYRFHVLIDHADLYWVLLRSRRFLRGLLRDAPPLPPENEPLIVLGFHYGQGMALMHWLVAAGRAPRFVSIRLSRDDADSSIGYAYARLRNRAVERLTGRPLILTGGARREIGTTLSERVTVLGLVDVPQPGAQDFATNATLLGHPVVLPSGLVESIVPGTRAIVVSARIDERGNRRIEGREIPADALTMTLLASELSRRLEEAPAAWHFWHLWPQFLARPNPPGSSGDSRGNNGAAG